ncbi:hypothetical protein ACJMK2_038915 [Sinanodonta woodiana]|uniref:General transcription factor 3C polypeptide 5 n=1 Tax=Sinanodonta woodiana TaxID=1069815 RepID=A0ABD3WAG6_SINWO
MDDHDNWKENEERINIPYNGNTKFVCVEHPGVIKNADKALETIGNVKTVSKIYNDPSRRLALNWRPRDAYCKPVYGHRCNTTSLLLKVTRRKKKGAGNAGEVQWKAEVVGVIETTYKYQALVDYQYLPIQKKAGENGTYENLLPKVVVQGLEDRQEFLSRDVPFFLPPTVFTRVDNPIDYLYRPDMEHTKKKGAYFPDLHRPDNLIGTVRQRRTVYTIFVNYGKEIPDKALDEATENLNYFMIDPKWVEETQQLFKEHPCWLKVMLKLRVSFRPDRLKYILPIVAYYYLDGPWRCQWVKIGYDPSKDPSSKIYQTIDYRVKQNSLIKVSISTKRGVLSTSLWNEVQRNQSQVAKINLSSLEQDPQDDTTLEFPDDPDFDKELLYTFKPGKLPPYRLIYYQACNVLLDEVQALIKKNNGKETGCNERDGWCVENFCDQTRMYMKKAQHSLLDIDETLQLKKSKRKMRYLSDSGDEIDDSFQDEDMDVS